MEKRYTVKLDAYLYAENDEQAKARAEKLAKRLRMGQDNSAQVIELNETPYGSFTNRKIKQELCCGAIIMKIETKFNIGDTCFYLDSNAVVEDKIMGMEIDISEKGVNIYCLLGKVLSKDENIVHRTKEDLLNSL